MSHDSEVPAKREERRWLINSLAEDDDGPAVFVHGPPAHRVEVVEASYAQSLERERDALKADYDRWTAYASKWKSVSEIIASNDQLRAELEALKSKHAFLEQNYAHARDNEKEAMKRLEAANEKLTTARIGLESIVDKHDGHECADIARDTLAKINKEST